MEIIQGRGGGHGTGEGRHGAVPPGRPVPPVRRVAGGRACPPADGHAAGDVRPDPGAAESASTGSGSRWSPWTPTARPPRRCPRSAPTTGTAGCSPPGTWSSSVTAGWVSSAARRTCSTARPGWPASGTGTRRPALSSTRNWCGTETSTLRPATTHGMALLDRADRPTAIFAGSDMQAMGVLRAARRLGLEVPGQLSLIGYDNLPLVRVDRPRAHHGRPAAAGHGRHRDPDGARPGPRGRARVDQGRPGDRTGGQGEHGTAGRCRAQVTSERAAQKILRPCSSGIPDLRAK